MTAGQFPKFADEVYKIENPTDDRMHFMLPDGRDGARLNLHRGEILAESDLPHKLFAYTPCFRREAGSHRADERGMVRGHQFNKVEMFQYTLPEDSPTRPSRSWSARPSAWSRAWASTSAPSSSPRATARPPWRAPTTLKFGSRP